MAKRKCKYRLQSRKSGYAVTKSGRTILKAKDMRDVESMLCGWLGVDKLPDVWNRCRTLYA